MNILAIDTSADDTCAAVTHGRRVLSSIQFSQIDIHKNFGGIYPYLAKREHQVKISPVIELALKKARINFKNIDAIAITYGPGLPPALEVGVLKAKELARMHNKPLIPVDHIEGHMYSSFVQNSHAHPAYEMQFPCLSFVISGGHTQLVLINNHIEYNIIGSTLDDAAGEALDKAAVMLGFQYPGGPVIEQFAKSGKADSFKLPIPMQKSSTLDFSYSGVKTAFKYLIEKMTDAEKNNSLANLCASFQFVIFESLLQKLRKAILVHKPLCVSVGGGVSSNRLLRKKIRTLVKSFSIPIYFPPSNYLCTDNAAMIGVVGYYKYLKGIYVTDPLKLDRIPRANLDMWIAPQ